MRITREVVVTKVVGSLGIALFLAVALSVPPAVSIWPQVDLHALNALLRFGTPNFAICALLAFLLVPYRVLKRAWQWDPKRLLLACRAGFLVACAIAVQDLNALLYLGAPPIDYFQSIHVSNLLVGVIVVYLFLGQEAPHPTE